MRTVLFGWGCRHWEDAVYFYPGLKCFAAFDSAQKLINDNVGQSSLWGFLFCFTRIHTDRSSSSSSVKHQAPLIHDGFDILHQQTPLSLYLFLQTGGGEGLAEKERRGERWKKQNKFSDTMPEAERLCRRTGSPSSPRRTDEKMFFKRCQKQRASPANREEGRRRRRRCQSDCDTERLIWPSVNVYIYNLRL